MTRWRVGLCCCCRRNPTPIIDAGNGASGGDAEGDDSMSESDLDDSESTDEDERPIKRPRTEINVVFLKNQLKNAIKKGKIDKAARLMDQGVEYRNGFHLAVQCGQSSIVKLYLDREPMTANRLNRAVETAALIGDVCIVEILIKAGGHIRAEIMLDDTIHQQCGGYFSYGVTSLSGTSLT